MTVIANNGASVQMILPNFMRARGMAVHQMVFFGAMVAGSLLWGKIADLWSVQAALIVSALALAAAHRARCVDPAAAARRRRAPECATSAASMRGACCSVDHKTPRNFAGGEESPCNARTLVVDTESKTPTHVPLALSGYATTESVLFGSAGSRAGSGKELLMFACRAGRRSPLSCH